MPSRNECRPVSSSATQSSTLMGGPVASVLVDSGTAGRFGFGVGCAGGDSSGGGCGWQHGTALLFHGGIPPRAVIVRLRMEPPRGSVTIVAESKVVYPKIIYPCVQV